MKIIIHPKNYEIIKQHLNNNKNFPEKLYGTPDNSIHLPFGYEIIPNEWIPKYKQNGWKRTGIIPDNRFVEMVDIENPPRWAIYFGLVEPNNQPVFYVVDVDEYKMLEQWLGVTNE